MYRIGEFSKLSKTTIKTLRFYEKQGILKPIKVDKYTHYRYYETHQLIDLAKIVNLRQVGISIKDIKKILTSNDDKNILTSRKNDLEKLLVDTNCQLLQINKLLGEGFMKYQAIKKIIPSNIVYYKEGVVSDFGEIVNFILTSATECKQTNPDIKCVQPDYCYTYYLDREYKEKDIKIGYAQAVTKMGTPNDKIGFKKTKETEAICVYHKGSYKLFPEAYAFLIKWINDNGYEITEPIRECYIDGAWNKEDENDYLTEIQAPVKRK